MTEGRKIAAILVSDIVGFSRMAEEEEERTLARLRALRGDIVDPAIAVHGGRIIKSTGDGVIAEFRSVVEAARCAIEVQNSLADRNEGLAAGRRISCGLGSILATWSRKPTAT